MKKLFLLLILIPIIGFAQDKTYYNEISTIEDLWQVLYLNENVLSKVQSDLSDIRIISVSKSKDTTEVPYILEVENQWFLKKNQGVNFKIINKNHIGNNYYYTFKLNNEKVINEILLDFQQNNYNWEVDLQGSQNQKKWFSILENYRILSIKNQQTNYKFSTLNFPDNEYKYYRLKINSKEKPILKSASLQKNYKKTTSFLNVANRYSSKINKKAKTTEIEITLEKRLPVSKINFEFDEDLDFQRSITISCLTDSFKTDKGWKYNYRNVKNSYVSSLGKNDFYIDPIFTNKLKISINNFDNEALKLREVNVSIFKYKLIARFSKRENQHFLTYGDKSKRRPNYDIINFKKTIPKNLKPIEYAEQISILNGQILENETVITKWWLWSIIILIIIVLGFSTLSMLKKDSDV